MKCPFCEKELKFEWTKGIPSGKAIMFCENDNCSIKPCTEYGCPTHVIEEAKLFGKIKK